MMDIKTIESIGTPFYVFDIDVLKNRINYDIIDFLMDPQLSWLEHPAHNRAVVGSSPTGSTTICASVAKLVDALDLGSSALRHGGSSPFTRTNLISQF